MCLLEDYSIERSPHCCLCLLRGVFLRSQWVPSLLPSSQTLLPHITVQSYIPDTQQRGTRHRHCPPKKPATICYWLSLSIIHVIPVNIALKNYYLFFLKHSRMCWVKGHILLRESLRSINSYSVFIDGKIRWTTPDDQWRLPDLSSVSVGPAGVNSLTGWIQDPGWKYSCGGDGKDLVSCDFLLYKKCIFPLWKTVE